MFAAANALKSTAPVKCFDRADRVTGMAGVCGADYMRMCWHAMPFTQHRRSVSIAACVHRRKWGTLPCKMRTPRVTHSADIMHQQHWQEQQDQDSSRIHVLIR